MDDLLAQVDPDALVQLTFELARIPSPTGDTARATCFFANHLREAGLEVELSPDIPGAPSIIARLGGPAGAPTLQFDGHIDTIAVPHPPPSVQADWVTGRGVSDMKGGLACAAEALRVLAGSRRPLGGTLLFTVHGMHEAPAGMGEGLAALIARGIVGDAVINPEVASDVLPIISKGMGVYDIEVHRDGEVCHENQAGARDAHPVLVGLDIVSEFRAHNEAFAANDLPYVGPESFFVGQFHCGDFFNRLPTSCRIEGTRRWAPERDPQQVEAEFRALLAPIAARTGTQITLDFRPVRDGFRLDPNEPIVRAVQSAYARVTGRPLPLGGTKTVGDVSMFVQSAGVPAVYHGPQGEGAHGDFERIHRDELVRATKVFICAAVEYLGGRNQ